MKNRHFYLFSLILFIFLLISSGDSRAQWIQTNGPEGGQINSIVSLNDKIFIATYSGIFASSDNGLSWKAKNNGLEYPGVFELLAIDDIIFAGSEFGIYRSTNEGESWSLSYYDYTFSFATDGTNIFATLGYDGIIMTADKGDTWNNIGLDNQLVNVLTCQGNILYAGTDNGVYITTNYGSNWTMSYAGLPSSAYIMALLLMEIR